MPNATFQTTMRLYPAIGVSGQVATSNPAVFQPGNPQADGDIVAGRAVWSSTNGVKNTGTGAPIGIVASVLVYGNNNVLDGYSMTIASGQPTTILTRGDIYILTTSAATVGQKVFANLTDGTFKTDTAGATNPGYAETTFRVLLAAAAGELTLVTNW